MIVNRTLNKIISKSPALQETLLDLTNDSVAPGNLAKSETAHDREGENIVGSFITEDAEAWAVGRRNGVPVQPTDPTYHNNSYWYSQVSEDASIVSGSCMRIAGEYADIAEDNAIISGSAMRIAGEHAEDSEAWAVGKRNGQDVSSTDPTFHNNSKFWADVAQSVATVGLRPRGTIYFADLPTISESVVGDMWNIEDGFVTTSDFREGAGKVVGAGANIYLTEDRKWDILAGAGYQTRVLASTMTIGGQTITEVEPALRALNNVKQNTVLASAMTIGGQTITEVEPALHALNNGGGGGGGHTIVNSSGTSMTQRSKLQFKNATVTDDSSDDTTEVESGIEMPYSDYSQLSQAEKEEIDAYIPDYPEQPGYADPTPRAGSQAYVTSDGLNNIIGNEDITGVGTTLKGAIANLGDKKMGFPDYSNVIQAQTSYSNTTKANLYTATQNCWVGIMLSSKSSNASGVYVNDIRVAYNYTENSQVQLTFTMVPLYKGDILSGMVGSGTGNYTVYGIR